MAKTVYNPAYYYLDEIYITDVVFDDTESVTIMGFLKDEKENNKVKWDFFCDFSLLTDLLLFCGESGDQIIYLITDKLSEKIEIPTIMDVANLFGKPLYIDNIILKVYRPHEKNDDGIWKPSDHKCFFIDKIKTKTEFFSEKPEKYIAKSLMEK